MIIGIAGKAGSGKDTVAKIIQYLTSGTKENKMTVEKVITFLQLSLSGYDPFMINEEATKSNWQIKKFADKLKECTCIILGCTREQLESQEFKASELPQYQGYYYLGDFYNISDKPLLIETIKNDTGEIPTKKGLECLATTLTVRQFLQNLGTEVGRNIHPDIWVNSLMQEYKNQFHNQEHCSGGIGRHNKFCMPNWLISDVRFPNEAKAIKDRGGIVINIDRPTKFTFNHESETALINYEFDFTIINDSDLDSLIIKVKALITTLKLSND